MFYDNIKSHKKPQSLTLFLEDIFSQKNQRGGGGQNDPTAF